MKTNKDDSIFAQSCSQTGATNVGLTKREYFAVNAPMTELLGIYCNRPCGTYEECASLAVNYADALITELNKDNERQ